MAETMRMGRRLGMVMVGWAGLFGAAAFLLVNVGLPRMGCGCEKVTARPTTQQVEPAREHGGAADEVPVAEGAM